MNAAAGSKRFEGDRYFPEPVKNQCGGAPQGASFLLKTNEIC
jgi:hypothetical protein